MPTKDPDNLLDGICTVLRKYINADNHKITTLALWTMHTHVYQKFVHTPRLVITSPVPNCGKTTVLDVLKFLVANSVSITEATPASIFDELRACKSMLMDEVDNLGIATNKVWRNVLNDGYKRGGTVRRKNKEGGSDVYNAFTPVALAGIGIGWLYPTLASRSIIVRIERAPTSAKIIRFNEMDHVQLEELAQLHLRIWEWANKVELKEPEIPPALMTDFRIVDKWRVLLAIGDNLGRGAVARTTALKQMNFNEDTKITLLRDIRTVFDMFKTKHLPTGVLVGKLLRYEDSPVDWGYFDYEKKKEKLTDRLLSRILRDFDIASVQIWWPEEAHRLQQKTLRGYARKDFEEVWKNYTPQQNETNVVTLKKR